MDNGGEATSLMKGLKAKLEIGGLKLESELFGIESLPHEYVLQRCPCNSF
jgi:hypothetical protein